MPITRKTIQCGTGHRSRRRFLTKGHPTASTGNGCLYQQGTLKTVSPPNYKSQISNSHGPFGETLNEEQNSSNYYSPFKFSAKEKDPEMRSIREDHWKIYLPEQTGYSYFGARYYSPELSLWLSVDPVAHKFPYQSGYTYCGWNPVKIIDPDGREEFELGNEKGVVKSVSQTQYFRDQKGNISTEKTDGTVEVDRVVDAKGREIYVEHGVLSKALRNPSVDPKLRFYQFTDDNDAANFFEFAARGSDVDWGYARQNGSEPSFVGTNEGQGHSVFGAFMEQIFGENLNLLAHSHPTGGEPSVDLMGPNDT